MVKPIVLPQSPSCQFTSWTKPTTLPAFELTALNMNCPGSNYKPSLLAASFFILPRPAIKAPKTSSLAHKVCCSWSSSNACKGQCLQGSLLYCCDILHTTVRCPPGLRLCLCLVYKSLQLVGQGVCLQADFLRDPPTLLYSIQGFPDCLKVTIWPPSPIHSSFAYVMTSPGCKPTNTWFATVNVRVYWYFWRALSNLTRQTLQLQESILRCFNLSDWVSVSKNSSFTQSSHYNSTTVALRHAIFWDNIKGRSSTRIHSVYASLKHKGVITTVKYKWNDMFLLSLLHGLSHF